MKFHGFQAMLAVSVHLLATACGSVSGGKVADMRSQNAVIRALTENDLANANYRIARLGAFRLNKGEFKRQYGAGMTQAHKVTLEKVAFGDLDGDGLNDAAVILAWQSGGSGTFRYLMAMRNTGNALQQQDSVLLGDRIQIKALSIDTGQARLETVTAGPNDPVCCPSQQTKQAYSLRGGKWEQSADQTPIRMKPVLRAQRLPASPGNGRVLKTHRSLTVSRLTVRTNTLRLYSRSTPIRPRPIVTIGKVNRPLTAGAQDSAGAGGFGRT